MIFIKNLTMKNFMSTGNLTQAIDFSKDPLTLVLGENLDQGGDSSSSRNGTGKCLCINTVVKVRNTITGEIYETTVGDLYLTERKAK
jgi:hypothetical protein